MSKNLEIARLFSLGKFDQVANYLSENITFHVYEEDMHLTGKQDVLKFCNEIATYFASVETNFTESGYLVSDNEVAIYGSAEFKRNGEVVSQVNSCDIYRFDTSEMITEIRSFCNSKR